MAEFTLKPKEEEWLRLNIGDKSYDIPLATSLTWAEAETLDTTEGAKAFFEKHMGKEVIDGLQLRDFTAIVNAWKDASKKAMESGDMTPGES